MKAKEIIDLTTEEVTEKIELELEAYNKLKLTHTVATLENPLQLRYKRKNIARLKTELRKRQIQKQ